MEITHYLKFEEISVPKGYKTKAWIVSSGGHLGRVSWWSQWRRYCFHPFLDTLYDPKCLREIADFVEQKTKEHKDGITQGQDNPSPSVT